LIGMVIPLGLVYTPAMRPLVILAFTCAASPLIAQNVPLVPAQSVSQVQVQAQAAPTADEIIAKEQLLWKAYTGGDTAKFGGLMLPDFVNVSNKISTREEALIAFNQLHRTCSVDPVSIINPQVTVLSPDVATITYNGRFSTTCDSRVAKISINVSTVWVRHEGDWKMHLHTEFVVNGFAVQSH
jgi:hypothetical protein